MMNNFVLLYMLSTQVFQFFLQEAFWHNIQVLKIRPCILLTKIVVISRFFLPFFWTKYRNKYLPKKILVVNETKQYVKIAEKGCFMC